MTEIICISGKAMAGDKEMAARMLKEELEKGKKRVLITHYADPLKRICRDWFGWDGRMDATGRSFLRYVGTDIVRSQRPDFWVDFTLGLLSMMGDEWDYVIIPDCRHHNEIDLERYGFQPRHIRIEGNPMRQNAHTQRGPLGRAAPDFTIVHDDMPGRLRSEVAAVAQNLVCA